MNIVCELAKRALAKKHQMQLSVSLISVAMLLSLAGCGHSSKDIALDDFSESIENEVTATIEEALEKNSTDVYETELETDASEYTPKEETTEAETDEGKSFDYRKIQMDSVSSSFINEVGYSEEYEVLLIKMNDTDLYQYEGVDPSVYREFINAESLGKYFNANIKGQYEYKEIY